MAMNKYTMFGSHSAQNADIVPATAKVDDIDWKRM
jgi:hypothetical protein